MNDAGVAVIGWQVGSGPTTAQYAYGRPGAWFGKPITVASGGSYGPGAPSVAVDGRVDAAVCWNQGSPATTYATVRTVAGHSLGMRVVMPGNGGIHTAGARSFFALASDTTNGFRHTTQMAFSGDGGRTFAPPEELPGARSYGLAGAAVGDAGNALVVWMDDPGVPPTLYAAERGPGGAWSDPSPLVAPMVNPAFGFGRTRNVLAAWLTPGADTRVTVAGGALPR
jgi:hypothetical protein